MGEGPYFTFYRPYHLTSLEVPLTCARVVLYGKADMVPLAKPVAEVCAVAKKDLKPGETLDAIGEYCYRAWIMTAPEAQRGEGDPLRPAAGRHGDGADQEGRAHHLRTTPRLRRGSKHRGAAGAPGQACLRSMKHGRLASEARRRRNAVQPALRLPALQRRTS